MKNEKTAKRLSLALSNVNMIPQELSDRSGVSKASISQYMNGSHAPSNISSGKMGRVLGVNPLWLMGFDVPMEPEGEKKGVPVPVLGSVAAGIPLDMIEDIRDIEEIPQELSKSGKFFALTIKGDSMAPDIYDGDTVIVRCQADAENGDTVIAQVNGDESTCKRLHKFKGGVELIPNNPSYPILEYSNKEIIEKPVRIIGRVIEVRRKM